MVWEPTVGGFSEFREMVVVLARGLSMLVQYPAVKLAGEGLLSKVIVGLVQESALISVTDRVAVLLVVSWRSLAEMAADKVGVGVTGNTVKV
jgi:Zn-dependent protease with chaperone function